jgi:hypothetical protein
LDARAAAGREIASKTVRNDQSNTCAPCIDVSLEACRAIGVGNDAEIITRFER